MHFTVIIILSLFYYFPVVYLNNARNEILHNAVVHWLFLRAAKTGVLHLSSCT